MQFFKFRPQETLCEFTFSPKTWGVSISPHPRSHRALSFLGFVFYLIQWSVNVSWAFKITRPHQAARSSPGHLASWPSAPFVHSTNIDWVPIMCQTQLESWAAAENDKSPTSWDGQGVGEPLHAKCLATACFSTREAILYKWDLYK